VWKKVASRWVIFDMFPLWASVLFMELMMLSVLPSGFIPEKNGGKSACLGSHVAFADKRDIFGNDDGDANDAATISVDQLL